MGKPKLPNFLEVALRLTHIGGWTESGQVACTYETALEGQVEVISRTHLYHRVAGRDLYPTKEQFAALQAGEQVTLFRKQWA